MRIPAALSRRRLLGTAGGALALVGANGSPARGADATATGPAAVGDSVPGAALNTEFVLEVRAGIAPAVVIGEGADGLRRLVPITGGSFEGPRLRGEILPGGGDWQLVRPDGVTSVEAKYTLRTHDGALVSVTNRGIIVPGSSPGAGSYLRTVPEFEAPRGPHEWLNRAVFVASLDASQAREGRVIVRVFRVV